MVGSDNVATVACATDAAGHFEASMPGAVAYSLLSVSRAGFIPAGWVVPNNPKAPRPPERVPLVLEAVISGKVLDADGLPAEGAWVEMLRYSFTADGRKLIREGGAPVDDLGEYRIFNAYPGLYYLRVVPSGKIAQWDSRYIPEYYLGTLEPLSENRVRVEAGQEQHGIDFQLARHEGITISGHVVMPEAVPAAPIVLLGSVEDNLNPPRTLMLDPADGSFVARHVPPGTWTLRAMAGSGQLRPGDFLAERTYKVGDTDIRDVVLAPRVIEPQDVTGKVIFEGGMQPHAVAVGLRRNTGQVNSARTGDDGSFVIHGVLPGHYRIDVQATNSDSVAGVNPGFTVSARLGDREALRHGFNLDGTPPGPLQITVTEAVAILEGRLVDKNGLPVAGGRVMVYGDWCRLAATTDRDGAFRFDHLYRGEYRVVPLGRNDGNPEDTDVPPVEIVEGKNPPLVLTLQ